MTEVLNCAVQSGGHPAAKYAQSVAVPMGVVRVDWGSLAIFNGWELGLHISGALVYTFDACRVVDTITAFNSPVATPWEAVRVWRGLARSAATVCRALSARLPTLWLREIAISSHQLDGRPPVTTYKSCPGIE
ncbi:hypothetical protein C8R44DRAFT_725841 [Mycena epipterygia]|nr:hypothetical protein C8R44DRAFT_725841 [Mycena epipterygia]